ncbi:MAG: hypothetical protein NC313_03550 [Butyrivibrio sp.]|nr:hypothetical protein [Butyrivibrio sp.]
MNTLSLSMLEGRRMNSRNNFETALYIVGKCNPFEITRLALKRGKRFESVSELSRKELIRLGELNLYRKLNGTLGKNRKYSLRKIRNAKSVREKIYEEHNGEIENRLSVRIPAGEYVEIVRRLYEMLKQVDKTGKASLIEIEKQDVYGGQRAYSSIELRTVAPIQTGIVMSAVIPAEYRGYVQCLEKLKDEIRRL